MAASESAAFSEKESGVLEGVAIARITRENRTEPQWWKHRRGGVTARNLLFTAPRRKRAGRRAVPGSEGV